MDKAIKFKYFLFLLGLAISVSSYSQESMKKLQWKISDSNDNIIFYNKEEIIEWSKNQLPFSTSYSYDISIEKHDIYIVTISGCSGLPCWMIYIFRKGKEHWELIMTSSAKLAEQIEIEAKDDVERIIFKTRSGLIDEIPFSVFQSK